MRTEKRDGWKKVRREKIRKRIVELLGIDDWEV